MYARYLKTPENAKATRYTFREEISLFGCNEGYIPWLLKQKLPPGQGEPWKWHVDMAADLGAHPDYPNNTLLIFQNPKHDKNKLFLYEVMDVWGCTENGWSPILLRLNGLYVEADPSAVDLNTFVRQDNDISGPIYEFLYLTGSISGGKLAGPWVPPPANPTNAALLWPSALNYFFQCIRTKTPDVLQM